MLSDQLVAHQSSTHLRIHTHFARTSTSVLITNIVPPPSHGILYVPIVRCSHEK